MPVIHVGKCQARKQLLVAVDEAIRDGAVHKIARSVKLLRTEVWTVLQQVADPLVVDLLRPFGAIEAAARGKLYQKVAQRGWIENASVQNGGVGRSLNSPSLGPGPGRPARP